jgi:hypothetical protein
MDGRVRAGGGVREEEGRGGRRWVEAGRVEGGEAESERKRDEGKAGQGWCPVLAVSRVTLGWCLPPLRVAASTRTRPGPSRLAGGTLVGSNQTALSSRNNKICYTPAESDRRLRLRAGSSPVKLPAQRV